MGWLVSKGKVLASAEVADSAKARLVGLLGKDEFEGALVLRPCKGVHTVGMKFPIDVAFCDEDLVVLATTQIKPHRFTRPHKGTKAVVEAEAGSFARWGLMVGDELELRE